MSALLRAVHAVHADGDRILAQDPVPKDIAPDKNAPGASAFTDIIGVLMFYGVICGVAAVIIGAITFGLGRFFGHQTSAVVGRIGILAGMASAIIVGGAAALVNWSFNLGADI